MRGGGYMDLVPGLAVFFNLHTKDWIDYVM